MAVFRPKKRLELAFLDQENFFWAGFFPNGIGEYPLNSIKPSIFLDILRPREGRDGGRSAPKLFPELLEEPTCSKMGLRFSSPKNIQLITQLRYLSHFVREV